MSKPKPVWQETWSADTSGGSYLVAEGNRIARFASLDPKRTAGQLVAADEARVKLAALAPRMVRLLLDLQTEGPEVQHMPTCPSCGAEAGHDERSQWLPHAADCDLAAILREAGALP